MANNPYTTLISVRLENGTLKAIDQFCDNRYYLKRSAVINQALKRVFSSNGEREIYDFLYYEGELKKNNPNN